MKKFILLLASMGLFLVINAQPKMDNPVAEILFSNPSLFKDIIKMGNEHEVQIIYTQINRDENNAPSFKTWNFGQKTDTYFYPASTVKMPAAFLAMEKINKLNIVGLDKHSIMKTGIGSEPQTAVEHDSTSANNFASVAHYAKKIFVASDNDAYNRLYEFIGQKDFNESLRQKGFEDTRIISRLGGPGAAFDKQTNRYTNPVSFFKEDQLLYHQGEVFSTFNFDKKLKTQIKGVAYKDKEGPEGKIIKEPFSFENKNYFSLQDMHDILQSVLFPEATGHKFELSEDDYQFLYKWMSARPRECDYPKYDSKDSDVKFFIYGGETDHMPDAVRIFNKVGWSYGYLTDVSYIVDFENKVEFFVAAVIHVNKNKTYNDDVYEYYETGLPFFENFGKKLYEYELKREKKFPADLSRFKVW